MKSTLGPAGNERSPQAIWKGGKVEVGQKKNTRKNHRFHFWQPTQLSISWSSRKASICPSLLLSLTFPVCLRVTSAHGVYLCMQLCPSLQSRARWARLMKGSRLVVFSWQGDSLTKPRKWTSSKLFQRGLVFVVSHLKTT